MRTEPILIIDWVLAQTQQFCIYYCPSFFNLLTCISGNWCSIYAYLGSCPIAHDLTCTEINYHQYNYKLLGQIKPTRCKGQSLKLGLLDPEVCRTLMFTGGWNLLPQSAKLVTKYWKCQIAFNNVLAVGGRCSYGNLVVIFISLLAGNSKDLFIQRNTNEHLITGKNTLS